MAEIKAGAATKSGSFKGTLNYVFLQKENQLLLKKMNDIYIEAELAVQGLKIVLDQVTDNKVDNNSKFLTLVPSNKKKYISVSRKVVDITSIIQRRIDSKEYIQSLIFGITLIEDYISTVLIRVIRAYPSKLFISPKGNELKAGQTLTIDVKDVIRLQNVENVILEKAESRVREAMYASPTQYHEYFKGVLNFGIGEADWLQFVEMKATRDLYVHGDGTANNIYVQKTGVNARAKMGSKVPIDATYLQEGVKCFKRIVVEIYKGLRSRYAESVELSDVLNAGS